MRKPVPLSRQSLGAGGGPAVPFATSTRMHSPKNLEPSLPFTASIASLQRHQRVFALQDDDAVFERTAAHVGATDDQTEHSLSVFVPSTAGTVSAYVPWVIKLHERERTASLTALYIDVPDPPVLQRAQSLLTSTTLDRCVRFATHRFRCLHASEQTTRPPGYA